uniref:Uncharacterized protein n=1 Tax=Megaselia scalaris TaxID=36166 RepID=T1GSE2_MEGSC
MRTLTKYSNLDPSQKCPIKPVNETYSSKLSTGYGQTRNLPLIVGKYKLASKAYIEDKHKMIEIFNLNIYVDFFENNKH